MSSTYSRIAFDRLTIPIGGTFAWDQTFFDKATGDPANWTGWSGRAQIRDTYAGQILAEFASDGSTDGELRLSGSGNLTLYLADEFTSDLSPITNAVGDLLLTNPDGETFRKYEFAVQITEGVTQ